MELAKPGDIVERHRLTLRRRTQGRLVRQTGNIEGNFTAVQIGRGMTAVPELNPGKRTMCVNRIGHHAQIAHIIVIAQACAGIGRFVGTGMNRTVFGAHHAPATLGLDAAQRRHHLRTVVTHAGAMRHLVKAVGSGYRAELNGFKQRVISRVTRH